MVIDVWSIRIPYRCLMIIDHLFVLHRRCAGNQGKEERERERASAKAGPVQCHPAPRSCPPHLCACGMPLPTDRITSVAFPFRLS